MTASAPVRGGFSIVELLIALVILTVGMLALAAGSGYTTVEVRSSALRTQRNAAISAAIEQLRARAYDSAAFDSVTGVPSTTPLKVGSFDVWYTIAPDISSGVTLTRRVVVYTRGPQYKPNTGWTSTSVETFATDLYRPSPPGTR